MVWFSRSMVSPKPGSPFAQSAIVLHCSSGMRISSRPFLAELLKKMSPNDGAMIARKPACWSAQGACSREEPQPKLSPATSTEPSANSVRFSTKFGSFWRQRSKRNWPQPVRSIRLRWTAGMIWSVSTFVRYSGTTLPAWVVNLSTALLLHLPVADVHEVAGNGGSGGHCRADQMCPAAPALPPLEVAVRGGGAALAGLEDVRVHPEAHRAASLAP